MSLTGNSEFPLLLAIVVVSVGYWFVRKLMLRLVTLVGRENIFHGAGCNTSSIWLVRPGAAERHDRQYSA